MKYLLVFIVSVLLGLFVVNAQEKVEKLTPEQQERMIKEFLNSYLPVRDDSYPEYSAKKPPVTPLSSCSPIGTPCRGNCEDFYHLCGAGDEPVYKCDLFENPISFYGKYGSDVRQQYYVYEPASGVPPKNEVVVLIHGGAWFSGPNPNEIRGFPSNFSTSSAQSLVKDLRDNGYTVISVLYRLMKLGSTSAQIISNGNKMGEILDDVEDAVEHFRAIMSGEEEPECLLPDPVDYTKYHIVGESAGGHIALMYAYTRANSSYIKSVTSLYAPTNMVQFSSWISNPPLSFSCFGGYDLGTSVSDYTCSSNEYQKYTHKNYPFYWIVDRTVSSMTQNYFDNGCKILLINTFRIYDGVNLIKGLLGKSSPTTSEYESISPVNQTNVGNIPTFIIHGDNDLLVPYNQATLNMENKLNLNGGVLNQNSVCPTTIFPTLTTQKHLIRLYNGVNHGMRVEGNEPFQTAVFNRTRSDILNWIGIH